MHSFMDSKLMAKLLRQALAERNIDVSHADSLEFVARQFGVANWNILSARIAAGASAPEGATPQGWRRSGKGTKFYRVGVDKALKAAWVESKPELVDTIRDDDFCTLMQTVDAAPYRGMRLRLSCQLRAAGVDGGVTLWFRVDGPTGSLRFENMEGYESGGVIAGTSDWVDRHIVLDVPQDATSVNFGFYLKGNGRGWARNVALEPVEQTVMVSTPHGGTLPRPTNLSFVDLH